MTKPPHSTARASGVKLLDRMVAMIAHMLRVRFEKHQIFRSVVEPVVVDMVDDLRRFEKSSDDSFHDEAVFENATVSSLLIRMESNHVDGVVSVSRFRFVFPVLHFVKPPVASFSSFPLRRYRVASFANRYTVPYEEFSNRPLVDIELARYLPKRFPFGFVGLAHIGFRYEQFAFGSSVLLSAKCRAGMYNIEMRRFHFENLFANRAILFHKKTGYGYAVSIFRKPVSSS